jgi:hypothetical protein
VSLARVDNRENGARSFKMFTRKGSMPQGRFGLCFVVLVFFSSRFVTVWLWSPQAPRA